MTTLSLATILRMLAIFLLLTNSLHAEFNPVLIKVMEKADIFGFSDFIPGVVNFIALSAISANGAESPPSGT